MAGNCSIPISLLPLRAWCPFRIRSAVQPLLTTHFLFEKLGWMLNNSHYHYKTWRQNLMWLGAITIKARAVFHFVLEAAPLQNETPSKRIAELFKLLRCFKLLPKDDELGAISLFPRSFLTCLICRWSSAWSYGTVYEPANFSHLYLTNALPLLLVGTSSSFYYPDTDYESEEWKEDVFEKTNNTLVRFRWTTNPQHSYS